VRVGEGKEWWTDFCLHHLFPPLRPRNDRRITERWEEVMEAGIELGDALKK